MITQKDFRAFHTKSARGRGHKGAQNATATRMTGEELRRALGALGVTQTPARGRLAPVTVHVARFKGVSLSEIARRHGRSRSWVKRVLRDHSIYCFGRVERFML